MKRGKRVDCSGYWLGHFADRDTARVASHEPSLALRSSELGQFRNSAKAVARRSSAASSRLTRSQSRTG